jgi:hypothetical protein
MLQKWDRYPALLATDYKLDASPPARDIMALGLYSERVRDGRLCLPLCRQARSHMAQRPRIFR